MEKRTIRLNVAHTLPATISFGLEVPTSDLANAAITLFNQLVAGLDSGVYSITVERVGEFNYDELYGLCYKERVSDEG